jgi:acetyltransferase-like isoleucine patch superfamily enzyme
MSRKEFALEQMGKYPQKREILSEIPEWVTIGKNVHIAKGVFFSPNGFGYEEIDGEYKHIPHAGKVIIDDNVEIHEGVNIVRATAEDGITRIGKGTKIDYNCHIAHNVRIGKNCLIVAGTVIGGSTIIEDNCYLGIGSMIKNKVRIGANSIVGMGAVVINNISKNETWAGNPARMIKKHEITDEIADVEYYDKVFRSTLKYHCQPQESPYYVMWCVIVNLINNKERIIELGCGTGQLAKLLIEDGKTYEKGYDYSAEAIKVAKRLNDKGDKFVIKSIFDVKFNKGETYLATEVFEHLDEDLQLINLLPKGARLIFSVPNYWSTTHRRVFKTATEIAERYTNLEINNVYEVLLSATNKVFLVDSKVI